MMTESYAVLDDRYYICGGCGRLFGDERDLEEHQSEEDHDA